VGDKILFVDDEAPALDGYRRVLRHEFTIDTAASGEEGLAAIKATGPYAVVISDMRMPGMSGAEFLAHVRRKTPDSVRMLLTGHADLDAAIHAVNKGNIFRFLTKPCEKPVLVEAIRSGLQQYRTATAEKELVKKAKLISRSRDDWEAADLSPSGGFEGSAGLAGSAEARSYLEARVGTDPHCFVILVKLNLLPTVEERYGEQAGQSYIQATASFLTKAAHKEDWLFHWSRDVLMYVAHRQISAAAVRMEFSRLLLDNPQQLVDINGRQTMLAISTTIDLLPAARFSTVDELFSAFDAKLIGKI